MIIEHINPEGMYKSPVFSQGIILPANARILVIGGQNAVDASGQIIIGKGDIAKQAEIAIGNMLKVLEAAGGKIENLVKTTIMLQQDADLAAAFPAWARAWGTRPNPPTVSALRVAALANPDFLIEVDAMAVLP